MGASVIALVLLATSGMLHRAEAAQRTRLAQRAEPQVGMPATILAEPASQIPIAIQVGPPDALPANSFIRLRGLPPSVSLSEGHAIGPGSWAIPLFGLATLKANIPAGVSGRSELVVTLVSVDGTLLAEGRTALVVGAAAMLVPNEKQPDVDRANALVPPLPVPAGRPDRNSAPRPPELSADEKARAEKLMGQGERYLTQGNVALAREFFRRAADAGLAQAAVRLAATYDPAELGRLQVQGVVPDRAEARKWYERARELGAPEAEERLARLGGS
jgi:TPR repeat protein